MNSNDSKLISGIIAGNQDAFEIWMKTYAPLVNAYLYHKIQIEQDREDLLQEIFIKAYTRIRHLRNPSKTGPWLLQIAANTVKDKYKAQSRKIKTVQPATHSETQNDLIDLTNEASSVDSKDLMDIIKSSIRELKEKYSTVVYLSLYMEYSSIEIATLLNMRPGTVRMRLKRGTELLRKKLIQKGIELPSHFLDPT